MAVTFEEYLEAPGVNWSTLKHFFRSSAHVRAAMTEEKEETPAMRRGTLQHMAVLEPERFAAECVAMPDFGDRRLKVTKEAEAEFMAANQGKTCIAEREFKDLLGMSRALWAEPDIKGLLSTVTDTEKPIFWNDRETGLRCKALLDMVSNKGVIVDIKTTDDVRFHQFSGKAAKFGYFGQAAYYLRGARASELPVDTFCWIALESKPPYSAKLYYLPSHLDESHQPVIDAFLGRYQACTQCEQWPSYPVYPEALEAPEHYTNLLSQAL